MSASRSTNRLSSDFSLGGEQAEADPLLISAFYSSGLYAAVEARDDSRCFLVGRTGSGKSALLRRLEDDYPDHVIRIDPASLSLPYISNLGVVNYLVELGIHLDPFFIALWKHVMLIEIIKHRYRVNTPQAKENFLRAIREKISRDRSKMAALDYLEDFEGKFWCETDERVKDITTKFEEQINREAGGKLAAAKIGELSGKEGSSASYATQTTAQLAERFQLVVNDTQLPRLNQMITVLNDDILDSSQHFTYVIIDDLDTDWVDETVLNALIRCLFRTVMDLKKIRFLKVIVALRTNIFEELDFGSRTGGQEEKFRALTLNVTWTANEMTDLLSARARAAASRYGLGNIHSVKNLLPAASNKKYGNPLNYIYDRTLMRPRDAITFLNKCFALAAGKGRLSWAELRSAEDSYSHNRLLALRDEWKPSYPDIGRALQIFNSAPVQIKPTELIKRLEDVAMLLAEGESFTGSPWLAELTKDIWSSKTKDDWIQSFQPLVELLFNIGFIGIRKKRRKSFIYSYTHPDYASRLSNLSEAEAFAVHPAFRMALDIE